MQELLKSYQGQYIKLIKDDGFLITGRIIEVSDRAIIFLSKGKRLLISFERIKEIRPITRGNR